MARRTIPYPNLELEMTRTHTTREDIANKLQKSYQTVHSKIVGDTDWTLPEAKDVKQLLGSKMSLDELFEKH